MSVSSIIGPMGELVSSPEGINQCFADFYRTLYSSRVDYRDKDLVAYLGDIDIPVLTPTNREQLDVPITVTEIQRALKSMQSGKNSGRVLQILCNGTRTQ